jgi:hypothetical protein
MTVLPNRSLLSEQVATVLASATGWKVAFDRIPDLAASDFDDQDQLISPYGIVYARSGRAHDSDFAETRCLAAYSYQVTWVGQTGEQAQFAAEVGRQRLLERTGSGAFLHPITVADAAVLTLYPEELGGPEPGGGALHQVVDIFDLEVESVG